MRWIALLLFLVATTAHADYRWKKVADVSGVQVEVIEVPLANEMRRIRYQFNRVPVDNVIKTELLGFSVLRKLDGQFRCTIYIKRLSDTETLEHERRHCDGWTHD